MKTPSTEITTIDAYIAQYPKEVQPLLQSIRKAIQTAAPKATECISYRMPAFRQNGILVYFAAFKNHIGFYPTSSPIVAFKDELAKYKTSRGAVQFPLGQPVPLKLIQRIVKFRLKENLRKAKAEQILKDC